jgi:hypothetical protein
MGIQAMTECKTHQLASLAVGIGAGATAMTFLPGIDWTIIGVTALSGYVGGLLADVDDEQSLNFRIVQTLSKMAAVLVPSIQFFYRPTDLVLGVALSLFLVSNFWVVLHNLLKQGKRSHSVIAAVCLSLGVSWVAYLTTNSLAAVPAFLAAATGYLVHLLLDDLNTKANPEQNRPADTDSALSLMGKGNTLELYGLLTIGLVCVVALWGI